MRIIAVLWIILSASSVLSADQTACGKAARLARQAYDMGAASYARQKELLNQAIALCPDHPESHNNLASILEIEKDYDSAMIHYRKSVSVRPDFAEAWFGIGEVYQKTGRFALSLEAYLKGCKDPDARKKIKELLDTNRYRVSEQGEILDKESLLLLFDKSRRNTILQMISECGFRANVVPEFIFRNILFDTGSATLKSESIRQIQEIASVLQEIGNSAVIITGHTDRQPFKGHTQEDSDRMNLKLSEDRAVTVKKELTKMGISADSIRTKGCGPSEPMDKADTPEAYAKNRRVAVEVRE
jgi:outer membrane protein OmpA-like peptidoglycan-associated protein